MQNPSRHCNVKLSTIQHICNPVIHIYRSVRSVINIMSYHDHWPKFILLHAVLHNHFLWHIFRVRLPTEWHTYSTFYLCLMIMIKFNTRSVPNGITITWCLYLFASLDGIWLLGVEPWVLFIYLFDQFSAFWQLLGGGFFFFLGGGGGVDCLFGFLPKNLYEQHYSFHSLLALFSCIYPPQPHPQMSGPILCWSF